MPPEPIPLRPERSRSLDPLVEQLVEAYQTQAEAQDRRFDTLMVAFEARDVKRDAQHAELVGVVGKLTDEMRVVTTDVRAMAEKAPGRRELWALGGALVLLLFVLVGLYAQANGDDAGKAIDDARRAVVPVTVEAP